MINHLRSHLEKPLSHYGYNDKDDGYERRNDEFYISKKKIKSRNNLGVNDDGQSSMESKMSVKGDDMFITKRERRPRKYTEYFPEMLNLANLGFDALGEESKEKDKEKEKEKGNKEVFTPR